MAFTSGQLSAIETTTRVASVLSLIGAVIIICSFLFDKGFQKPINRLVFYAAWGNILTNVATMISTEGIEQGGLCQLQGFLIQWFMPADALWAFAMACNVYLTFFHNYGSQQLRKLEWRYVVLCYGIPFVPAISYLFVSNSHRGKVYGSAVLWCWVSIKWDVLRIATFYGPVWVIIISTLAIYLVCGRVIFNWRKQLMAFAQPRNETTTTESDEILTTKSIEASNSEDVQSNAQTNYTATVTAGKHSRQVSGVPAGADSNYSRPLPASRSGASREDQHKVMSSANRAAINYCRVAILFFIALCVTWIPSTVNRVYTLVHPTALRYDMNIASGIVLSLQGFWNAVIYISTSWPAVQAFVKRMTCHGESDVWEVGSGRVIEPKRAKRQSLLLEAVGNIHHQRSVSRAATTESEEEMV